MAEFDKELYKVKCVFIKDEDEPIVEGFYYKDNRGRHFIIDDFIHFETNPYSLCRNTGIKKNGVYLYENDLVEYSTAFDKGMAMVEFDELRCRYMLRTNLDYSARADIEKYTIKVIGNVALSDDDMKRFAEYSKNQSYTKNIEPECRSKAHINKKAKEFLPR
jgi:hypothetical protein